MLKHTWTRQDPRNSGDSTVPQDCFEEVSLLVAAYNQWNMHWESGKTEKPKKWMSKLSQLLHLKLQMNNTVYMNKQKGRHKKRTLA